MRLQPHPRLARARVSSVFAALGLLFGVGAVAGATAAAADPGDVVACGDNVAQSIVLTQDLICSGTALGIAGDSDNGPPVVVDLAGHTVQTTDGASPTIVIIGTSQSYMVENGTIAGPQIRQEFSDTSYSNITFDGGGAGGVANMNVQSSHFIDGAVLQGGESGITVVNSTFTGPGNEAVSGGQSDLTMTGSTVKGYNVGISFSGPPARIDVEGNLLQGNGTAIVMSEGTQGVVSGNRVIANSGDGIALSAGAGLGNCPTCGPMTVTDNLLLGNGGDGIRVGPSPTPPSCSSGGFDVALAAQRRDRQQRIRHRITAQRDGAGVR